MQLYELSELGPNRDGYGAEAIDRVCVANVVMILAALPSAIPAPEM